MFTLSLHEKTKVYDNPDHEEMLDTVMLWLMKIIYKVELNLIYKYLFL